MTVTLFSTVLEIFWASIQVRHLKNHIGWFSNEIIETNAHVTCEFSDAQAGLSTYVSVPGIVQQLSNLQSELTTLQSDLEYALPEDRNRCINEL